MTTDKIPDIPGTSPAGTGASSARHARPAGRTRPHRIAAGSTCGA
jgi:hypothetical protein